MKYKILASLSNAKEIENEEKVKFLFSTIESLGVALDSFWSGEKLELAIDERMKLMEILGKYNIHVVDELGDSLRIYKDREVVAIFNKPTYVLRHDRNELDMSKKNYYEICCDVESVFEEEG